MKKASEFIKSSATFTGLLYSFSVITVKSKLKQNVNGFQESFGLIENLICCRSITAKPTYIKKEKDIPRLSEN